MIYRKANGNPSKCDDAKKVFFYWGWPAALEQQFREPTADFISGDYIRYYDEYVST